MGNKGKQMTKQATHVVPADAVQITISAAEHGGFMVLVNCGWDMDRRNMLSSGASFSTAEECGAWVLSCMKNITAKKFGEQQR